MKSMTGFGRARKVAKTGAVEVQISCVNKRGQEISVGLPRELSSLEGQLYDLLKDGFDRGKLQLTVRAEPKQERSNSKIEIKFKELKSACKALGVKFEPTATIVRELMRESGNADNGSLKSLETTVLATAKDAIGHCQKAQAQEGARLSKDFILRIKKIEELRAKAALLAPQSIPLQREKLIKNLTNLGLNIDTNDERVLKEVSIFADRVDVAEELTRITSHCTALKKLIQKDGSIGRQVEFLLQELLREWNTLGNKSPQIDLIQTALDAKNEIERMKEQAANIA